MALKTSSARGVSRSSSSLISVPLFRNASSRSRSASVSRLNSRVSTKISGSGQNRTRVPVFVVALPFVSLPRALAALVGLGPREPVAGDLDLELLAERVHDRDADAVQAAGDGVATAAELAAGVQHREHDLDRGAAVLGAGDRLDRDAASVVEAR